MVRAVLLALCVVAVSGCGPTYEAEYQATLKELDETKLLLAEAQKKLSAADHETRSKIFSLARRATTHLKAEDLDRNMISTIQQEMALLSDSYAQLNSSQDITALTGQFYSEKLSLILELWRKNSVAYDRQFNSCLSDLDSQGKKNELSTMLCEVQAAAAGRKPLQDYRANLATVKQIGLQLRSARQLEGSKQKFNSKHLQEQYRTELEKQMKNTSG